ncbi:MAG: efflux RND transporter periplasmic adaptor subunit, partial [Lentisphaeria bacterium]|nr:efflux RND transporter periplasmic adaptor subunit [Lentisphaeria bacterium]
MSVGHILGNRRNGLRKTGSATMLTGCCLLFFIWTGVPLLESVLTPQAQAADERHDDHAGHDHGDHVEHDKDEGSDDHDGHDEHTGHEQDGGIRLTPEIIEATGIRVRVAGPGILGKRIKLIGEISVNENTFAHIVPAAAGVVREVAADIGERVQAGDVLAILDSREVGEAALEHSDALTAYELSVANFERQKMVTTNTHKMLEILSREDDPQTV